MIPGDNFGRDKRVEYRVTYRPVDAGSEGLGIPVESYEAAVAYIERSVEAGAKWSDYGVESREVVTFTGSWVAVAASDETDDWEGV